MFVILNLFKNYFNISEECRNVYKKHVILDSDESIKSFKKTNKYSVVIYNTVLPLLDNVNFSEKEKVKQIIQDAEKVIIYKADKFFIGIDQINNVKCDEIKYSENKRIAIVVPNYQYIEADCMKSIYNLIVPPGYTTDLIIVQGYTVETARNFAVKNVLNEGYDYTLWVDSDIILPFNILERLLATNSDIATGWYCKKLPGSEITELYGPDKLSQRTMVNIMTKELPKNGVIPIIACGFGCTLVKNEVYNKIGDKDWFHYTSTNGMMCSEDIDFCIKAKDKGCSIVADCSMRCQHIGRSIY